MNIIKAIRVDWQISDQITIDCYQFPDGEKRIGITGASIAIGKSKEYLGRLPEKGKKALKALTEIGYDGWQKEGVVNRPQGGTAKTKTISKRDFVKLITRNVSSIILLAAFAETKIDAILDNLFAGRSVKDVQEKIIHYTKWTNEDLQKALFANYEDWAVIKEQELFLKGKW